MGVGLFLPRSNQVRDAAVGGPEERIGIVHILAPRVLHTRICEQRRRRISVGVSAYTNGYTPASSAHNPRYSPGSSETSCTDRCRHTRQKRMPTCIYCFMKEAQSKGLQHKASRPEHQQL
eukprot:3304976-Pyramimonas_sp.AAC.1